MIAAGLVAGSLVLAGCGSDDKTTTTPPPAGLGNGDISLKTGGAGGLGGGSGSGGSGGGSGSDSTVDHVLEIKAMKVCPMVDMKPMATALKATISVGPDDIPPMHGLEPGGVACAGQFKGDLSQPTHVDFSAFNISAVGYSSESETKTQFRDRLTGDRFDGAEPTVPLDGDWDEGSLIVVGDQYSSLAYALVRKGTWLVKVDIQVHASGKDPASLLANREAFRPLVVDLVKSVYDGVSGELDG